MMNEEQPPLHNNNYLFSDHFLNIILREDKKWETYWAEVKELANSFSDWLFNYYQEKEKSLPNYSEEELRMDWFQPIFQKLGHYVVPEPPVSNLLGKSIKFPDYLFFKDEDSRKQLSENKYQPEHIYQALAVGEVKKWAVPLGRKSEKGSTFAENNPSFQIDYYVRATKLTWGILSNGKLWRLVHINSSYKLDTYFEIDLEKAIQAKNQEAIAFFLLFFHQNNFRPDVTTGISFLDSALQESIAYTIKLEEDIQDKTYFALEQLIQGFFEAENNQLTESDLPQIYTNSLYFLYRLIFLFYGESRGLLPVHNPTYQTKYSLKSITAEVAHQIDSQQPLYKNSQLIWNRLQLLFNLIDGRSPALNRELNMPVYNGGLFNAQYHPFLEQKFVGDFFLSKAIDALARQISDQQKMEQIDYRSLGVRQIGSIYEGLLEFKPFLAKEPLVSVKNKQKEMWVLESKLSPSKKILTRKAIGETYLTTDDGERKVTGSYYTPDYIVKYMVEEVLEPLVQTAVEQSSAPASPKQLATEILKLRVLDPAMGSGHFLVEATDYLARKIATDNSLQIGGGTDIDEDDLINWRRQVAEQCIYGVDKNPLAVELAKLSLWLITAAKNKPLSFLDHHLRMGDSLVGATLQDLVTLPSSKKGAELTENQLPLYLDTHFTQDMFRAVGGMNKIGRLLSDTVADVQLKTDTFKELQEVHLARWRKIADLWTSHFFGNVMSSKAWSILYEYLQRGPEQNGEFPELKILAHHLTHPAVTNHDYFHWELEFPEIFFDELGQLRQETAGFDAIVSNPPYVRHEIFTPLKPFLKHKYLCFHTQADLYVYFLERGHQFLNNTGSLSYILSGMFTKLKYGFPIRHYLGQQTTIQKIVDFGYQQIFTEATTYPIILKFLKSPPPALEDYELLFYETSPGEPLNLSEPYPFKLPINGATWNFAKHELAKIFSYTPPKIRLGDLVENKIYRGITTGLNTAFILTTLQQKKELLTQTPAAEQFVKPVIKGGQLSTWSQPISTEWLIVIPAGWTKKQFHLEDPTLAWQKFQETFPSLATHLQKYENLAQNRDDQGDFWWELRPCTYYDAFQLPRLHSTKVSRYPTFSFSEQPLYAVNTSYVLSADLATLFFILGFLNSRVFEFYARRTFAKKANGYFEIQPDKLSDFLIPILPDKDKKKVIKTSKKITQCASQRAELIRNTLHRIQTDLSFGSDGLSEKLTSWWLLSFQEFRSEIQNVFKQNIPIRERPEWEAYLAEQQTAHHNLTQQIIALEIELNQFIYKLYGLTQEEIKLIEEVAQYPYGAN